MVDFSKEFSERIISKLTERKALLACPRCGSKEFSLENGFVLHTLAPTTSIIALGTPAIPVAVVICQNCGFISEHALGALGLLDSSQEKDVNVGFITGAINDKS
jgi:predicted nucleic-acid-binding Zn-ribbon protein